MEKDALLINDPPTQHAPLTPVLNTALLCVVLIGGGCLQVINLPKWIDALGSTGPYFILLFSSFFFVVIFGISSIILKIKFHPQSKFKHFWGLFVAIGVLNAINGLLIVYAADPNRTPPILQALFPNVSILYSMVATKLLVNRELSYLFVRPILSLLLVAIAVGVSLLPRILAIADEKEKFATGKDPLSWSLVFLIGVAPGAVYNVYQEKFLKSQGNRDRWERVYDTSAMLFFGCSVQLLTLLACFWVDILPWYGYATSFTSFASDMSDTFSCFFNLSHCRYSWVYGSLFLLGYVLNYVASAGLNQESANFNMLAAMLISPIAILFWVVFPQRSLHIPPWWSILFPLLMFLTATVLWKTWEREMFTRLSRYSPI